MILSNSTNFYLKSYTVFPQLVSAHEQFPALNEETIQILLHKRKINGETTYEIFKIIQIPKRMVFAETIHGNTVHKNMFFIHTVQAFVTYLLLF